MIAALLGLFGAFLLTSKTTAHADDGTPSNDLYWGLDNDTGVLTLSGTSDNTLAPYSTVTVSNIVYPAWYNDRASIASVTVTDSVYAPSSMAHWFYGCSNLTTVNLSNLDTSQVTYMAQMLYGCSGLTTLDMSNFDTSLVTDMSSMFSGCNNLDTITVSNSLAQTLSETSNTTYLYGNAHATWYGTDGTAYTDSNRFSQGGTYISESHEHSGGAANCSVKAVCSTCGNEYGDFDSANHAWNEGEITTQPTCTTDGVRTFSCIHNSEHTKTETITANGHTLGSNAVRVEPNCTTDGSVTGTCTVCGTTDVEVLPKLGHDIVRHNPQAATCTEKGYAPYESCSRCDHTTYSEIAALGHSYGEWTVVKEATETEEGEEQRV